MSVAPVSGIAAMAKSTTPLNYTVNVIVPPSNPFSGTVSLGAVGLPGGATATFNPPTITGAGSSTMSIAMNNVSVASNFTFSVIGQSGVLNRSATNSISVQDFMFVVSPAYQVVAWQSNPTVPLPANFTLASSGLNGFSQNVFVSLPAPLSSCVIQSASAPAWPATLPTPSPSAAGTINFTAPPILVNSIINCFNVTAIANGISHSQQIYVEVKTSGDFSINVSGPQTIAAPGTATYNVSSPS